MARLGKYVVTGELGRGENALVQSALDPVIGRPVAMKVVGKSGIERLRRQAQAAGSLHHQNIAAIYEYGEDEAQAWIAMEIVHGKTLREHLAGGYQPSRTEVPGLLVQLLEALDYAHGRGVTHGELIAENVMISGMGEAKILNFGGRPGAERADLDAAAVLASEVLGTPAPEGCASARELLDALRAALRPKGIAGNVGALRRAIKSSAEAPKAARKLPAVLFVDDEERVLNALSALFQEGYEVETASSGAAALERLRARRFLVVVSDQRMPEMTGVDFLREAKALAPGTVRLLLTGYSDLAAIVGSVNESEVFRFVSKPWQQEDLQATLGEAVSVAIALEAAEAGGRSRVKTDAAVLVLGEPAIARGARELAGEAFRVLEAADSEAALEILAREEVGVLVCDLQTGSEDPAALLRVLKGQSPHTQLIVVSAVSDSDLTIGLINEARIHRLVAKPVNLSLLQQAIGSALERYARVGATPALGRTERAKPGKDSAQARSLLERIKRLGGRFARAIGTAAG